jgi:DNA replication and repair protein RecF
MKSIEVTGKTIDEAIEQGLKELNCNRDDVEVEILEAPSRGLFGLIGAKDAKVKLKLRNKESEAEIFGLNGLGSNEGKSIKAVKIEKTNSELIKPENKADHNVLPENAALNFLEKVFDKLELKVEKEISRQEDLDINYESLALNQEKNLKNCSLEDIEAIFSLQLEKHFQMEIYRGITLIGPHRDDLKLAINGVDVRKYGSQGQQRTTALSLKIAELELVKSETGEYPVLLLDDVMSELDESRRNHLLLFIGNKVQTFITTTDLTFKQKGKIFFISQGEIKETESFPK